MKNMLMLLLNIVTLNSFAQKDTVTYQFKLHKEDNADFKYSIAELVERQVLPTGELNDIVKELENLNVNIKNNIFKVTLDPTKKYRIVMESNNYTTFLYLTPYKNESNIITKVFFDTNCLTNIVWNEFKGGYSEDSWPLPKYYNNNNMF